MTRLRRNLGTLGQSSQSVGGQVFSSVPMDDDWFAVKILSVVAASGSEPARYLFEEWYVPAVGAAAALADGRKNTSNDYAVALTGAFAEDDFALAKRSFEGGGQRWQLVHDGASLSDIEDAIASAGVRVGRYARLTTDDGSGNWKFVKLKLASGTYVDDGSESAGYDAIALTIDGSYLATPATDTRVWLVDSTQAGKYEFIPYGYASALLPGLIAAQFQSQTIGAVITLSETLTCEDGISADGLVAVGVTPGYAFGTGAFALRIAVAPISGSGGTITAQDTAGDPTARAHTTMGYAGITVFDSSGAPVATFGATGQTGGSIDGGGI